MKKQFILLVLLALLISGCFHNYKWKSMDGRTDEQYKTDTQYCLDQAGMVGPPWSILTFGWIYNMGKHEINEQCLREKGWIE